MADGIRVASIRNLGPRILAGFSLFLILTTASPAMSDGRVNVNEGGIALHGYDPVAYFTEDRPVEGDSRYAAEHGGATYLFAGPENRSAFLEDPDRFAPAYGGYCAYGVRVGRKFDVDPEAWRIVDGRLYMQLDQGTQAVWLTKLDENISIADKLWPDILPLSDNELRDRAAIRHKNSTRK